MPIKGVFFSFKNRTIPKNKRKNNLPPCDNEAEIQISSSVSANCIEHTPNVSVEQDENIRKKSKLQDEESFSFEKEMFWAGQSIDIIDFANQQQFTYEDDDRYREDEITYYESYDNICDFDINEQIDSLLLKCNQIHENLKFSKQTAKDILIQENIEMTKGQFAIDFLQISVTHNLTEAAKTDMYNLMTKLIPRDSSLPNLKCKDGTSNLRKYMPLADVTIRVDCCEDGHCVYVGTFQNKMKCSKCHHIRYTPCKVKSCTTTSLCQHSTRTPISTIKYHSLTCRIAQLLQFPFFLQALNYLNLDLDETIYTDICSGTSAKEALASMKTNFITTFRNKKGIEEDSIIEEVNLLLSIFYDAAQLYKHSVDADNYEACVITILNLPPTLRPMTGIGTFSPFVNTFQSGSECEKFLFQDCFISELNTLYKGKTICMGEKRFFVQCRLILHIYDTPEFQSIMKVHFTNSLSPSPLSRLLRGTNFGKQLKNTVFLGYRRFLPYNHQLRRRGQSQQCCPKIMNLTIEAENTEIEDLEVEHYPEIVEFVEESKTNRKVHVVSNIQLAYREEYWPRWICTEQHISNLTPCDTTKANAIKLLLKNEGTFTWFNNKFKREDFPHLLYIAKTDTSCYEILRHNLYYEHADYREQVAYRRISNETFFADASQAQETGEVINGVKGVTNFINYTGFDYRSHPAVCAFHTFKNICCQMVVFISFRGTKLTSKVKDYCTKNNMHPSLLFHPNSYNPRKDEQPVPCWQLSNLQMAINDVWFQAILLPKGFNQRFRIPVLFHRLGHVKGHDLIHSFIALIPFMIYCIMKTGPNTYPASYAALLCTVAEVMAEMLSPEVKKKDLDNLKNKVYELLAVCEGALLPTECTAALSQLIDQVNNIALFGPVRNFSGYHGEQTLGQMKKKILLVEEMQRKQQI